MQASQSTNAEGKRAFPSPFTAPIQAARRLMERQQQTDPSEDLPESASLRGVGNPEGLTGAWLGQLRYDEASIVAKLDAGLEAAESALFEEGLDPTQDFEITDSAHDKQDQPYFKSPFVSLGLGLHGSKGPDLRWDRGPDPVAVRAAITRLARESQSREASTTKDTVLSEKAAAFADAVAFEDVARRVWGEVHAEGAAPPVKENISVTGNLPVGTIASDDLAAGTSEVSTVGAPSVSPADGIIPDGLAVVTDTDIAGTLTSIIVSDTNDEVVAEETSVPDLLGNNALVAPPRSTEEGECLAHDAGNLLSAMRLYSELLCISGVLQERHRHYADDLKLLATRSQKLIDRLLKLGARLGEAKTEDLALERGTAHAETGTQEGRMQGQYTGLTRALHDGEPESAVVDTGAPQSMFDAPDTIQTYTSESGANPKFGTEKTSIEAPLLQVTETRYEGTNVAATLERMGNLLQTISHGALRIDLGPEAALPVAVGLEPLERILVNLVCNATAAVKAGGAIRVRAGVQDRSGEGKPGTMVLTVDDSGCGMTAEQIHAVLGERDGDSVAEGGVSAIPHEGSDLGAESGAALSDQDRDKSTGTRRRGLGLRIVRELVAASGGRLFIQSQPGTGTRIEIHWQTLTQPTSLLHPAANSLLAPLPQAVSFDPGLARKPVGVSRNPVSRIRAGSVAGDGGVVAC